MGKRTLDSSKVPHTKLAESSLGQRVDEAEVLSLLHQVTPERVEQLLYGFLKDRPELGLALKRVTPLADLVAPAPLLPASGSSGSAEKKEQQQTKKQDTVVLRKSKIVRDTVQFGIDRFYCTEQEQVVDVTILRLGDRKGKCAVSWHTEDISAVAGQRYEAANGRLLFEDGDVHKTITVKLLAGGSWQGTTDFKVVLHDADNCLILTNSTRVKVIDDSLFPTDKYKDELAEAATLCPADEAILERLPRFTFMLEYWRVNLRHPTVYAGSIGILLVNLLSTILSQTRTLLVNKYLIDNVLNGTVRSEQTTWLIVISVGYFVPALVERWLAYRQTTWKVAGTSRLILQENLLKRFLAYNDESRSGITGTDCIISVLYHVPKLVKGGFSSMFQLIRSAQTLIAIMIVQVVFIGGPVLLPLASLLVGALILAAFFMLRVGISSRSDLAAARALKRYTKDLEEVLQNQSLLKDMHRVFDVVDLNVDKIKAYNKAQAQADGIAANNLSAAVLLTIFSVASYIAIAGYVFTQSTTNTLTVGDIRSTISNLISFGSSLQSFYSTFLTLTSASVNLSFLACLLNRKVEERQIMADGRRRIAREISNLAKGKAGPTISLGARPEDCQQLLLDRVEFEYPPSRTKAVGKRLPLLHCALPQGTLSFFLGQQGIGKDTTLALLAGSLLPREGTVFVPPHLKMMRVCKKHQFIETMSLWQNITLGLSPEEVESEECPERVTALCKRLELSDDVIESILRKEPRRGPWERKFSDTELSRMNLCRAFVANPAVLVMEAPALHLNDQKSVLVAQLLRDFVDQRGLELDPTEFQYRHPRTVVATMLEQDCVTYADQVLRMTTTGLEVLDPVEASLGLLL